MWRWTNVPIPETYVAALLGAGVLQVVAPLRMPLPQGIARLLGWPALAAGIGLAAWAVRSAGETDVDQPSRLVTSGAYAVSRNPMYVGWSLTILGAGAIRRNAWLLGTWLPASRALHREVLGEEVRLAAAFGARYAAYAARVGRYW
jgi:protein-S-isoprenylcysteine O-methyltransferase Ste14